MLQFTRTAWFVLQLYRMRARWSFTYSAVDEPAGLIGTTIVEFPILWVIDTVASKFL